MPKISEAIQQRRCRLANYCIRHTDELYFAISHNLNVWGPKNCIRNSGQKTFIDILKNDCECIEENVITVMMDIEGCKS